MESSIFKHFIVLGALALKHPVRETDFNAANPTFPVLPLAEPQRLRHGAPVAPLPALDGGSSVGQICPWPCTEQTARVVEVVLQVSSQSGGRLLKPPGVFLQKMMTLYTLSCSRYKLSGSWNQPASGASTFGESKFRSNKSAWSSACLVATSRAASQISSSSPRVTPRLEWLVLGKSSLWMWAKSHTFGLVLPFKMVLCFVGSYESVS